MAQISVIVGVAGSMNRVVLSLHYNSGGAKQLNKSLQSEKTDVLGCRENNEIGINDL